MKNNKIVLGILAIVIVISAILLTSGGKEESSATPLTAGHVGIYLSGNLSATAGNVIRTLVMDNEQAVSLKSDYGKEEPAITEIGTWTSNDENQIVVTITGQKDKAYEEPKTISFELKDGVLAPIGSNLDASSTEEFTFVKQP